MAGLGWLVSLLVVHFVEPFVEFAASVAPEAAAVDTAAAASASVAAAANAAVVNAVAVSVAACGCAVVGYAAGGGAVAVAAVFGEEGVLVVVLVVAAFWAVRCNLDFAWLYFEGILCSTQG